MKYLIIILISSSCSLTKLQCFSIDGKAALACERQKRAEDFCDMYDYEVEYVSLDTVKCKRPY